MTSPIACSSCGRTLTLKPGRHVLPHTRCPHCGGYVLSGERFITAEPLPAPAPPPLPSRSVARRSYAAPLTVTGAVVGTVAVVGLFGAGLIASAVHLAKRQPPPGVARDQPPVAAKPEPTPRPEKVYLPWEIVESRGALTGKAVTLRAKAAWWDESLTFFFGPDDDTDLLVAEIAAASRADVAKFYGGKQGPREIEIAITGIVGSTRLPSGSSMGHIKEAKLAAHLCQPPADAEAHAPPRLAVLIVCAITRLFGRGSQGVVDFYAEAKRLGLGDSAPDDLPSAADVLARFGPPDTDVSSDPLGGQDRLLLMRVLAYQAEGVAACFVKFGDRPLEPWALLGFLDTESNYSVLAPEKAVRRLSARDKGRLLTKEQAAQDKRRLTRIEEEERVVKARELLDRMEADRKQREAEKEAVVLLRAAKDSIKRENHEAATQRLEILIKKYPDTSAAKEAAALLKQLKEAAKP